MTVCLNCIFFEKLANFIQIYHPFLLNWPIYIAQIPLESELIRVLKDFPS